jgi:hypothetical protein
METLGNKNVQKMCKKFNCNICYYYTDRKSCYDAHNLSAKHQKLINGNILETEGNQNYAKLTCTICFKEFKHRSGLWKHKKICKVEQNTHSKPDEIQEIKEFMNYLMKENSEFKNIIMDTQNQMFKMLENGTHNTINSHNKSFNLQFFLNETCKNAMNITDFVDSLQLQLSDLEKVGEVGYIEGISNIIIKNLKALDITLRPVHCTDKKRETMYIKDQDKWEKEDDNKTKLHKMVRRVSNKNIDLISEFKKLYPDWKKSTSKVSDQFNKIIIESMGGPGDNDYEKEEKIIKRVAKEVFVDKSI